ncbi:hypothetical protein H4W31_001011 [Plantactinospora soyae]|uniref:Tetracyclin repressor-like C-terminal domain-containing protein n=1 Tax=Plantactinospora soyae TaxID=1544732 RepID=A0A927LZG4_9ACTN|nr:hypothetical protein [Plantactinospora soyae]
MRELKKERLRAAQLAEDANLDVAVDLLFGPILNRWLQRTGPLTPEYAGQVVETALGGLRPREP